LMEAFGCVKLSRNQQDRKWTRREAETFWT
jgi:hypothetical protein